MKLRFFRMLNTSLRLSMDYLPAGFIVLRFFSPAHLNTVKVLWPSNPASFFVPLQGQSLYQSSSPESLWDKPLNLALLRGLLKKSEGKSPWGNKKGKCTGENFSQRRKMLRNSMKGWDLPKDARGKIDFTRRPETLTIEEFASMV